MVKGVRLIMQRLQTRMPCRMGGKHEIKRTITNYNIDTLKCTKCGDAMPTYVSEKVVKQRLGDKTFTCGKGHTGKCADNLEPLQPRKKPVYVVKCRQCGELIDESSFV